MAVTATTLAELNDLAKDYFTDIYVETYNPEVPLKNALGKLENAQFTGKKWIHAVKTSNGGGSANAGARKQLPNPAEGNYDQGECTTIRTYTRMALDAFAIEVTKRQQGSFKPALAAVMEDRLTAHDLELNRQMFSAGNGRLALVSASGANSDTQTLQDDYGVAGGGNGTRHVYPGDTLAFRRASNNALVGRKTVLSVDPDTQQVTLDSAIDTTSGQCYVAKSTDDADNYSDGEGAGLLAGVSNAAGTFQAIPSSGRWRSLVSHNNGVARELTDTLVMTMIARIKAESRKTPKLAITRMGVILRYTELFLPLRRIDGLDGMMIGGYKPINALQYSGGVIPVMDENDCPNGQLFFVDTDGVKMASLVGTEWASLDGAQFDRIQGQDGIEGYIRTYWNLFYVQRNSHGVLRDLEDIPEIDRIAAA